MPITRWQAVLGGLRNTVRALWSRLRIRQKRPGPYTILITGASAGVGLELSRILLDKSAHRLVLTARPSSLSRFAEVGIVDSERVLVRPLDVTDDAARKAVIDEVTARWGGVDVLVNNAGLTFRCVAEHVTEDERIAQMNVNFLAPMSLTQLVLPSMRAARFGRIVNVSSVGGMTAMPTMSVYSASKFALEGASESLWYEVRPWGIAVTLVEPGFINSDGFLKVLFTDAATAALADPKDPYHEHYRNMESFVGRLMTLTFQTPRDVAETIVDVIEARNPPLRVAGTMDAWLFDFFRRFLPHRLYHRLLYAGLPRVWEWGK